MDHRYTTIITVTSLYLLSISQFSWFRLNINRNESPMKDQLTFRHQHVGQQESDCLIPVSCDIHRPDRGIPERSAKFRLYHHETCVWVPPIPTSSRTPSPFQTEIPAGVKIRNCLTFPGIIQLDCSASNQTYSEWNLIGVRPRVRLDE